MHIYIEPLIRDFEKHENVEEAYYMKKYMRNKFEYYGIKQPIRKEIFNEFLVKYGLPEYQKLEDIILDLWEMPQRECQYAALDLVYKFNKHWQRGIVELFEKMTVVGSWWDTVDTIAVKLIGEYFKLHPEQVLPYTEKWMETDNIWLQRTCILFQLKYKQNTDTKLLTEFILECKDSKEFFLQKAIGWALREYYKTDPQFVLEFVESYELMPVSKREAIKIEKRTKKSAEK
jgi:3-methyladenine DNA glycosylase AlkD